MVQSNIHETNWKLFVRILMSVCVYLYGFYDEFHPTYYSDVLVVGIPQSMALRWVFIVNISGKKGYSWVSSTLAGRKVLKGKGEFVNCTLLGEFKRNCYGNFALAFYRDDGDGDDDAGILLKRIRSICELNVFFDERENKGLPLMDHLGISNRVNTKGFNYWFM